MPVIYTPRNAVLHSLKPYRVARSVVDRLLCMQKVTGSSPVRSIFAPRAMDTIKNLDSTAIYAYTTLISVLICVPAALIAEGPRLSAGIDAALAKDPNFYTSLFMVGLLYHLYNQVRGHPSMCPLQGLRPACGGTCMRCMGRCS